MPKGPDPAFRCTPPGPSFGQLMLTAGLLARPEASGPSRLRHQWVHVPKPRRPSVRTEQRALTVAGAAAALHCVPFSPVLRAPSDVMKRSGPGESNTKNRP